MTTLFTESRQECPICYLDFEEGEEVSVCPCHNTHVYHKYCLDEVVDYNNEKGKDNTCAICRSKFKPENVVTLKYGGTKPDAENATITETQMIDKANMADKTQEMLRPGDSSAITPDIANENIKVHAPIDEEE